MAYSFQTLVFDVREATMGLTEAGDDKDYVRTTTGCGKCTAATIKVVDRMGLDYCLNNPEDTCQMVAEEYGFFINIGLIIMSVVFPPSAVLTLIEFIVPEILRILQSQRAAGMLDDAGISDLYDQSTTFLKTGVI